MRSRRQRSATPWDALPSIAKPKAGESNNLAVEVKPPQAIAAGQHPVVVHLSSENPIAVETARMSPAMIVLGVAANTGPRRPRR